MPPDPAFAVLPPPPYYAVMFSSRRTDGDHGYAAAAERMVALAATMPGYLGAESTRGADGFGITISYWDSEAAILNWKMQADHTETRRIGRARWYEHFEVRVAKVERAYGASRK